MFITLGYRYLIICKVILIGLSEVLREALDYLLERLVQKNPVSETTWFVLSVVNNPSFWQLLIHLLFTSQIKGAASRYISSIVPDFFVSPWLDNWFKINIWLQDLKEFGIGILQMKPSHKVFE